LKITFLILFFNSVKKIGKSCDTKIFNTASSGSSSKLDFPILSSIEALSNELIYNIVKVKLYKTNTKEIIKQGR
jgi:hypothetical protein